jgi:hypothetical protein
LKHDQLFNCFQGRVGKTKQRRGELTF